jgi:replicative DNA helicase
LAWTVAETKKEMGGVIDLGLAEQQHVPKYRPPETPTDPVEAFKLAMLEYGLEPGAIEPSGKLIRFDVEKRGDKCGYYVFHSGGISAGAFGNWKTGLKEKWCSKARREMTDAESAEYKQMVAEARRQRKEREAIDQAETKERANRIWDQAKPAPDDHPYLVKKEVPAHGLKLSRGRLVVPVKDADGEIWNLQFIRPDGVKRFLKKGRKQDCSYTIPGQGSDLYIGEGFATMATIYQATGGMCICAFDAGNLPRVAKVVRDKCPTDRIIICADDDRFSPGNPGMARGKEAAKAVSGEIVAPVFDGLPGADDPDLKYSDFNDLACVSGSVELVKKQLQAPYQRQKLPPLTASTSMVKGRLKARPKPLDFIFRFNDQGLIPRGVVGVLTATGGTGKTFFFCSLAIAGAGGGNFGPINAPNRLKTLFIVAEDTQDELDRRLWDTGKGVFPESLHAASIYGEVGPLMRLEGSSPIYADGYYWLEETIKGHPGLELLLLDPKSRLYGLDENNNDHATHWIQALEGLSKRHNLTILFSHHTGKDIGKSGKISQAMGRGASAIVDGCRWQGGLVRMDKKTADFYGIKNPREFIIFDAPKSNYAADLPGKIMFRRGENGVLQFTEPARDRAREMGEKLLEKLELDPTQYTKLDLTKEKPGKDLAQEMVEDFSNFKRSRDMTAAIDYLIRAGKLFEVQQESDARGKKKTVLSTTPF